MSSEGRGQKLNPNWWYLHGKAYDFSEFAARHPGGPHAIGLGKGRDCTALFESYHTVLPSQELLSKYEIAENTLGPYPTRISKICFKYEKDGYYYTVKQRAREYFKSKNLKHTKGTWFDIFLWIVNMLALGITFYYAFVRGSAIAALLFGISKSLMVVESTHACSHYSFSIYPRLNRFVYWWNMCIAGDTPAQWTAKHVIAHHIDTNITPEDNDTIYPLKRVLPRYRRCWWHSYQHLYMWLFYFFIYYPWTLSHNLHVILAFVRGKLIEGVVEVRHEGKFDWIETLSCIVIHHMTRLAPYFLLDSWFSAIFVVVMAELSSSMWFSLQFAVNHEIAEATVFSDLSDKVHDEGRDFGAHQLLTSHNYSMDFSPSLHLSGGLNYQIEHHLFPSVHYKYYPDLAQIVKQTAKEFNLPYNASATFFEGVRKHYQLLKEMGSKD